MRSALLTMLLAIPCAAQISNMDVTSSRALGTIYQNTTGDLLGVSVTALNTGGGNMTLQAVCDSGATPTLVVQSYQPGNPANIGYVDGITFIVPPNYFYQVTTSGGSSVSLVKWIESTFTQITSTTQTDVTVSRSFGTVFHNTTNNLIWVEAVMSGANTYTALSDTSNPPTTTVGKEAVGTSSLLFIVLPGYFYEITASGGSLTKWVENSTGDPNVQQNIVTSSRVGFQNGTQTDYQAATGAMIFSAALTAGGPASSTNSIRVGPASPLSTPDNYLQKSTLSSAQLNIIGIVPHLSWYDGVADNAQTIDQWTEWVFPSSGSFTFFGEKKRRAMN